MKDLFIKFLKEYKLYYRFVAYYNLCPNHKIKCFEEYLETKEPMHYVTEAFAWLETDEGDDFWNNVDEHWDEYREKHEEWSYTIIFKSNKLNDSELIRDVAKLLEEKYEVKCSANLKTSSIKLS